MLPLTRLLQPTMIAATACGLAACATDSNKPARIELPTATASYSVNAPTTDKTKPLWWNQYTSAELKAELLDTLRSNPALRAQRAAVNAARANLDAAEAARWLDVDVTLRESFDKTDNDIDRGRRLGLDFELPLDVFGRLRGTRNAVAYDLVVSIAELAGSEADTVAEFLTTVTDAVLAREQQTLLAQQTTVAATLLELTELRFAQGQASIVDVLQQRELLASLHQQLPVIRDDERRALNTLATLQGANPYSQPPAWLPRELLFISSGYKPISPVLLIGTRADLVVARARLAAQNARYETTLLAYLPSLQLNGSTIGRIIDGNGTALISAMLDATWRLFDSGARDAAAAADRAALEQQGALLLKTWVDAINEVDSFLYAIEQRNIQIARSGERLLVAQQLLDAARQRYERGVTDYLPVLAALRTLQSQQASHLNLKATLVKTTIRALHAQGSLENDVAHNN